MMVLGLTGGVGAGKSRILELFSHDYGAQVIQADLVARKLEDPGQPGLTGLVSLFGAGILQKDGTLDRKGFADRIFGNPEALKRVNALIHPLTWNEIKRQIRESSEELIVVEAALFDERSREVCQYLLYVDTQDEIRIQRLMENRGYSREKCLDIMKNQADRNDFLKLADFVIDNSGSLEESRLQIRRILKKTGYDNGLEEG
ncbi:dephospho-CoA kinase [Clostridium sp. AF27-2AA]|jgi:dephospho-CoA kinase|uniref:dephospho-CoA kinase n=1 Tax=Clostridium sp. AF27-2AA TaxID=2292206 RepID=UPI000E4963DA|nr:dephospho-CoA kinase [Clostridium sp. AF27-2AA]RHQ31994.1 dephospho-CoA kinase [Clostridium sp. AF27-2AA]